MRIVVNGWFADQLATGSGQYLAGLQAWLPLAGADHEYFLVTPAATAGPEGVPGWRVVIAGTPLDRVNANLAKVWFEQVTFPRACKQLRADVALVPYWGSPWWQPCPLSVTVHDIIPVLLPLYRGGFSQRAYTWLVTQTARRAAAVLTDSAASGRDIVSHLGVPASRVYPVHLAADPRFRPVRDTAVLDQVRSRYGLPGDGFLLYLGGFDARKNVPRLLTAYARLRERRGDASDRKMAIPHLVIAGKLPSSPGLFAPDPRPIVSQLGLAGCVHFTGWVEEDDKPVLYSLASAALFVSEYEGFGLPVLEAQACGCPVITSF